LLFVVDAIALFCTVVASVASVASTQQALAYFTYDVESK
jgi:hypothetical protein